MKRFLYIGNQPVLKDFNCPTRLFFRNVVQKIHAAVAAKGWMDERDFPLMPKLEVQVNEPARRIDVSAEKDIRRIRVPRFRLVYPPDKRFYDGIRSIMDAPAQITNRAQRAVDLRFRVLPLSSPLLVKVRITQDC